MQRNIYVHPSLHHPCRSMYLVSLIGAPCVLDAFQYSYTYHNSITYNEIDMLLEVLDMLVGGLKPAKRLSKLPIISKKWCQAADYLWINTRC